METLPIVQSDPYLEPYASAIYGRYEYCQLIEKKLLTESHSLS